MRNIEELAAEEGDRLWGERTARLRSWLWAAAFVLAGWGWYQFAKGELGPGALKVTLSLLFVALAAGVLRVLQPSLPALMLAFLSGALSLAFFFFTRLPSFYWGPDPQFFAAVHQGVVPEPLWSPLGYLVGQCACALFPGHPFGILPVISGALMALGLALTAQDYFFRLQNKTLGNSAFALGVCLLLIFCPPLWSAGTQASGIPAALGFLIFRCQRTLLDADERPWGLLNFLTALLFSVHPLWGLLGILDRAGHQESRQRNLLDDLVPVLWGLSPYLWIVFRSGQVFPSWGADHPFWVLAQEGLKLLRGSWTGPMAWRSLPQWFGWGTVLLASAGLLGLFGNMVFQRAGHRIEVTPLAFWIAVLAGIGGLGFPSLSCDLGGVTLPWFLAETGAFGVLTFEKVVEPQGSGRGSRRGAAWVGTFLLTMALALCFWKGNFLERRNFYFPQQHAMNLLRALGPHSILVCEDPFQAWACREALRLQPSASPWVILDLGYFGKKWYATQLMRAQPEVLISGLSGDRAEGWRRFVRDNRDHWEIHLDQPVLHADLAEGRSFSTVLTTRFFAANGDEGRPESVQSRYDLVGLPAPGAGPGAGTAVYLGRYVRGFNQMGSALMDRGRYSEAIRAFDRSLKLDPGFQDPQDHLAWLYSQRNMLEAAQLEFEKTLKDHPARIAEVMRQLDGVRASNQEQRTMELLDRLIFLNGELANSQYQLSRIYDKEGRGPEAKELLEASLNLNPKQLSAQLTLGRLMKKAGNRVRAQEAFHAALVLDPENKEAQVEYWKILNNR